MRAEDDNYGFKPLPNEAIERFGEGRFQKLNVQSQVLATKAAIPETVDPLVVPIYHASTYRFRDVDQFKSEDHGGNRVYQRCGNPTIDTTAAQIAVLEGADQAMSLMYGSGLNAITSVFLEFLSAGDHFVSMYPIYSGTQTFIGTVLRRMNIQVDFIDVDDQTEDFVARVEKAIKPNTKMIYTEVLANPSMGAPDLQALGTLSKKHDAIRFCVDTTFGSPYLVQPLLLGADISLHSCSKFIGGHSDLIGGVVTCARYEDWKRLKQMQLCAGGVMAPWEASQVTRSLKTLALRMTRVSENALKLAQFLSTHPKVEKVRYPGLPSDPAHPIVSRYMKRGFGGMIAVYLKSGDAARHVCKTVRLIGFAPSLGGIESTLEHTATISGTFGPMKITPTLLRFSVGVEDADDLIEDFRLALQDA